MRCSIFIASSTTRRACSSTRSPVADRDLHDLTRHRRNHARTAGHGVMGGRGRNIGRRGKGEGPGLPVEVNRETIRLIGERAGHGRAVERGLHDVASAAGSEFSGDIAGEPPTPGGLGIGDQFDARAVVLQVQRDADAADSPGRVPAGEQRRRAEQHRFTRWRAACKERFVQTRVEKASRRLARSEGFVARDPHAAAADSCARRRS